MSSSSLEERSCAGRELFSSELEEREKVLEDLQGARLWLEAADLTLNGPHPDQQVERLGNLGTPPPSSV